MDKITKSGYENLRESHLCKNRSMYSLYAELNRKQSISRHIFFQAINRIRQEEGLNNYYTKLEKKKIIIDKNMSHQYST